MRYKRKWARPNKQITVLTSAHIRYDPDKNLDRVGVLGQKSKTWFSKNKHVY